MSIINGTLVHINVNIAIFNSKHYKRAYVIYKHVYVFVNIANITL